MIWAIPSAVEELDTNIDARTVVGGPYSVVTRISSATNKVWGKENRVTRAARKPTTSKLAALPNTKKRARTTDPKVVPGLTGAGGAMGGNGNGEDGGGTNGGGVAGGDGLCGGGGDGAWTITFASTATVGAAVNPMPVPPLSVGNQRSCISIRDVDVMA